eukprot:3130373-Rhodomonas_salina.1
MSDTEIPATSLWRGYTTASAMCGTEMVYGDRPLWRREWLWDKASRCTLRYPPRLSSYSVLS